VGESHEIDVQAQLNEQQLAHQDRDSHRLVCAVAGTFCAGRSGGQDNDIDAGRGIAQEPGVTAGARVRS
jgi:hypothetical protein